MTTSLAPAPGRGTAPARADALALRQPGRGGAGAERHVPRRHALELVEVGGADVGARLGDPGFAALPGDEVLAGVVEEQVGVENAAIQERSDQLPIRDRHAEVAV